MNEIVVGFSCHVKMFCLVSKVFFVWLLSDIKSSVCKRIYLFAIFSENDYICKAFPIEIIDYYLHQKIWNI